MMDLPAGFQTSFQQMIIKMKQDVVIDIHRLIDHQTSAIYQLFVEAYQKKPVTSDSGTILSPPAHPIASTPTVTTAATNVLRPPFHQKRFIRRIRYITQANSEQQSSQHNKPNPNQQASTSRPFHHLSSGDQSSNSTKGPSTLANRTSQNDPKGTTAKCADENDCSCDDCIGQNDQIDDEEGEDEEYEEFEDEEEIEEEEVENGDDQDWNAKNGKSISERKRSMFGGRKKLAAKRGRSSNDIKNNNVKMITTCPDQPGGNLDRSTSASTTAQNRTTTSNQQPKRYYCENPDCEKNFISSSLLTRHMRYHYRIKPYRCKFDGCGNAFIEHCKALDHVKKAHLSKKERRPGDPSVDDLLLASPHEYVEKDLELLKTTLHSQQGK